VTTAAPPLADILVKIAARRRERVAEARAAGDSAHDLASAGGRTPADNAFLAALGERRGRALIAEVKLGSPRLGSLVERIDPEAQARVYRDHGAAALSVVVEPDFFFGSYELLTRAKAAAGLPAIAKDFVVDPLQLAWAARAGADAVLLIAALLAPQELLRLAGLARGLGLVPLVETHDAHDVEKLAGAEWELVGINNRNLRTFAVDLAHSRALVPTLPPGALKVAESGIGSGATVRELAAAGFDAFLVGESLLLADDPGARLSELLS
jgi:indole-3-glycerol phosphate synthase